VKHAAAATTRDGRDDDDVDDDGGGGDGGDIKPRKQLASRPRHSTNRLTHDVNAVCICVSVGSHINTALLTHDVNAVYIYVSVVTAVLLFMFGFQSH